MTVTNLQELLDQIVPVSRPETGADRESLVLLRTDDESLIIHAAAGLPPVWADKAKLHLVLSNFFSNVIKFTPEEGDIVVEALA